MQYDKITITKVVHDKKSKNHSTLVFRVTEYHSNIKDTTGLGGTWSGSGSLFDVYVTGKYLIGQSWLHGNRPIKVWTSYEDMVEDLKMICPVVEEV